MKTPQIRMCTACQMRVIQNADGSCPSCRSHETTDGVDVATDTDEACTISSGVTEEYRKLDSKLHASSGSSTSTLVNVVWFGFWCLLFLAVAIFQNWPENGNRSDAPPRVIPQARFQD